MEKIEEEEKFIIYNLVTGLEPLAVPWWACGLVWLAALGAEMSFFRMSPVDCIFLIIFPCE